MSRILYAVFDEEEAATRTAEAVLRLPQCQASNCEVIVHEKNLDLRKLLDVQSLDLDETDVVPSSLRGLGLGALTGVVLALILIVPLDLSARGTTFVVALVVLAGVAGALLGSFAAALVGSSQPNRSLRKLRKLLARGRVLVTIKAADETAKAEILSILHERGATVEEKA